jgi:Nucleotidyl transferase of unknown function (DUF2204)
MAERQPAIIPETSSQPQVIPEEQQSLFREVLALLEKKRVPFAVAGAFALRQHTGISRDTKDLDLFLTSSNAAKALKVLEREGFECEVCDPVWLFKAHRHEFFVDLITGMSNATIVVDNSWIERAKPGVIYDVTTRVLGAEELIASKLFVTRRERFDGADIAHVIYGSQGKLEWQRVLQLAGENWEMVLWALVLFRYAYPGQTNFIPQGLWNELIDRYKSTIMHSDPTARFRGSLIDDKMFAIDVNEWGLTNLMQEHRERRLRNLKANGKRA